MNQHIGLAATQIPEFTSSVNLLVELKLSERYRMGVSIARGGCGAIYQAWDQLLDRSVAVKILLADDPTHVELKRFADEARVLGQLQHPHIPPVYDFGKILVSDAVYLACQDDEPTRQLNQTPLPRPACRERPFLAMKLVAGKTLAQILKSHSSQTKRLDLLPVFESICQAVGYAHEVGFIHRDLKPANVMVGAFGEVQVMDWGLAKNIAVRETVDDLPICTDIAGDDLTLCGTVMGTPDYMPPEQARGEIDRIDERSDVFSLGAILFEILTGTPPLTGAITEVVRGYACEKYIDRLTILDAIEGDTELKSLVKQCLSPDPAQRPRNGKEVADAIMSYRLDAERRVRQAEMQSVQATLMLQENQRRRVIVFRSAISIAFLLIAGIVGTTIFGIRAGKSEIKATQISDQLADANNSLSYRLEQIQRGNDLVFGLIDDFDVRTARSETESVEVQLARRLVRLNDNLTRDPIDDPEIDYKMKYRVGKALTHAGDFESAKRVFTSLREECLARYGLEHRKTLECSNALAEVYGEIGQQHDTALALTNQHYPLAEKVLGVQDEVTLSMAIGHVSYFAYAKQPQKAIEVGERVMPLVLAKYGPDHDESFSIRNNLALAYFGNARYDDAVRLHLENKVILDKRYGPYHPFSIKTLGNLTNNYQALGKKELHLECAEEASRRAHEKYGNNHRDTILYDINLANLYEELKRPVDAIRIQEQLLPVIRRVYGPQHAMYIQCSQQLIELYVKSGRLDDVELFANNMLNELRKNQHGEKVDGEQADPKNASIKLDIQRENVISLYERLIQNQNEVNKNYVEMGKRLGQLYREAKRPAQAIATYERLYKHCLKIYGPDHDETAEIAIPLADWCLWEKRYTEAITLYEFLRPHWNKRFGNTGEPKIIGLNNYFDCYLGLARWTEAIRIGEEIVELRRISHGEEHQLTRVAIVKLADTLFDAGLWQEAEIKYVKLAEYSRMKFGERNLDTIRINNKISNCLVYLKRYTEAYQLIKKQMSFCQDFHKDHIELLVAYNNLGVCLKDLDRSVESAAIFEDLYHRYIRLVGPVDQRTINACYNWSYMLRVNGRSDQAQEIDSNLLKSCQVNLNKVHPASSVTLVTSANYMLERGELELAEGYFRIVQTLRERANPDLWTTFNTKAMIGQTLFLRNRLSEAEPLLREGYEGMLARRTQIPAAGLPRFHDSARSLAYIYRVTGRPDKAEAVSKNIPREEAPLPRVPARAP